MCIVMLQKAKLKFLDTSMISIWILPEHKNSANHHVSL
jgi:hypothetical protein